VCEDDLLHTQEVFGVSPAHQEESDKRKAGKMFYKRRKVEWLAVTCWCPLRDILQMSETESRWSDDGDLIWALV